MALVLIDRTQEQGTANTTVSFTLTTSVTGFQSFAGIGNGNTTYYAATDVSGNWEAGLGTYSTTGPTLTRTTIFASSNAGSAETFSGIVNVFVTYPAGKSINYDANGVATIGTTLGYADTGIVGSFSSTVAGYNQVVVQNQSTATNASSNVNVSNDAGTASANYAELGINSSTFSNGAGCFNIPSASYLASAGTDLSIGTYGAYSIHFATNSNTTDSMTIYNGGGISLGTYGNPGIGNIAGNKFVAGYTSITSAAGITLLTNASTYYQRVVGTAIQTIELPDATTCLVGTTFVIENGSTGLLTITDDASGAIDTVPTGGVAYIYLIDNGTVAGTWQRYGFIPSTYDFNISTASFSNANITNALWNGTTIGTAYGGTGLTTFTAANNALFSTSAGALAAGTLPVAAGGTGLTAVGTSGNLLTSNGSIWQSTAPAASTISVTDDTTTATALFPTFTSATTGSITGVNVTSTKYTFVPTTGALTAPNIVASNGLVINNNTVSTSFTIPTGYNATATGPMTIAGGAVVTISAGSRWMIL